MLVKLNEKNIDRYNLVELTGNSRELMLSKAADAAAKNMVISCRVPDDLVKDFNVFDEIDGEHVDPSRLQTCGYEEREDDEGTKYLVCILHDKTSRHDVTKHPNAPCIQVEARPSDDQINEGLASFTRSCVYTKTEDPIEGTVYICGVHNQPSKYDISRLPNMPCLLIEPRRTDEDDSNRP